VGDRLFQIKNDRIGAFSISRAQSAGVNRSERISPPRQRRPSSFI
jgi:hypothetical protein